MILNLEDVKDIFHDLCDNFPVEIRIRTGYPIPFNINRAMSRPNPDRDVLIRSRNSSEIKIVWTGDEESFLNYKDVYPYLEEIYDRLSDYDYTIQFSFNYGNLLNDLPEPNFESFSSIHIFLDNSTANESKLIKKFVNFK